MTKTPDITVYISSSETRYDRLLAQGHDRREARSRVAPEVRQVPRE